MVGHVIARLLVNAFLTNPYFFFSMSNVTTHTVFALAFVSTSALLFYISSYISALLAARGWHVSDIILIGLDKKDFPNEPSPEMFSATDVINTIKTDRNTQAAAVAGIVTVVFILSKVFKSTLYRFGLPTPDAILGLPIGQHISVQAEINGKNIMRSYTPTSSDDDLGHFDLLVKSYEKGNISRYLSLLKIGDTVRIRGPKGQFKYHSSLTREIGMIAGGTGITPMLQIIRAALKNPLDRTKLSLIYANVNVEDILLRTELDEFADRHKDRFNVFYVLNNPPPNWKGGVGFVTKDQIERHLPATDHNIKVLMCGPPPMITAMKKHLQELNYPAPKTVSKLEDQVFLF
ncbi:hypothetical protein EW145_g4134 [Phellinidium pouzarii]|uniref:NADH-cytochrome b5 reductase n=1 Tax=Phellinidium pouzarii TaxID=167371 RepID=A0A4S4L4M5_9AGAM|nr:hypothetical protein EW145_g4134 [Phellinidium pouzarii]